ncbi:hypothetical protein [Nitratidesulfovibrio sp. 1201_IL3209]|uniref:hypothetical protein n=1 Tax=Nitratidesulfovibrio sp. 1201_IL3209 TaxID=3084053 RepID=UPI002FDB223D
MTFEKPGKGGKAPGGPSGSAACGASASSGGRGRVMRLPGIRCRFHEAGHCAVDETMNPGLNEDWRCGEEQRIVRAYDHFLEQADTFDLSSEQATALWERRLATIPPPGGLCADYTPPPSCPSCQSCADGGCDEADWLDCTHFREGVCVLLLPRCDGICERFQGA